MKHQHDDLANEQNAARAHFAMKWGYRAHNVLLIAITLFVVLVPLNKLLLLAGVVLLELGIWINGEAAQWHARATDEHFKRAEDLDGCGRCGALVVNGICASCGLHGARGWKPPAAATGAGA